MKLSAKKIIAREFLLLVGLSLLCFATFLITLNYNARIESGRQDIRMEQIRIKEQIGRIEKPVEDKLDNQRWLYDRLYDGVYTEFESFGELWDVLQPIAEADSIVHRWHNVWSKELQARFIELGFQTGSQLKEYIQTNSLGVEKQSIENQTKPLYEKIKELDGIVEQEGQRLWYYNSEEEMTQDLFILLSILVYPVRFFILALRWSIRTLRQKE